MVDFVVLPIVLLLSQQIPDVARSTYCRPFPIERTRQVPGGFILLERDGSDDGRVVPAQPGPDDQFWICQPAGEPVSHVFTPAGKVS